MDADEKEIVDFLKSWPGQFVAAREVCRRAGGKWRFREDENWAIPILQNLLDKGIIEKDGLGHFRLVPEGRKKDDEKKKWVASPQMKKILDESGKKFDGLLDIDEPEPEK